MRAKRFLLFFLIFSYSTISAQTPSSEGDTTTLDTDCSVVSERIKELYKKMFNSPTTTNYRKLNNEFRKKAGGKVRIENTPEYANCKDKLLLWIEKNIDKTEWQTYSQAEKDWQQKKDVYELIAKENPELFNYVKEMHKLCPVEVNKTFGDLIEEYGNDFVM